MDTFIILLMFVTVVAAFVSIFASMIAYRNVKLAQKEYTDFQKELYQRREALKETKALWIKDCPDGEDDEEGK